MLFENDRFIGVLSYNYGRLISDLLISLIFILQSIVEHYDGLQSLCLLRQNNITDIIHLENDVMIYENLDVLKDINFDNISDLVLGKASIEYVDNGLSLKQNNHQLL